MPQDAILGQSQNDSKHLHLLPCLFGRDVLVMFYDLVVFVIVVIGVLFCWFVGKEMY